MKTWTSDEKKLLFQNRTYKIDKLNPDGLIVQFYGDISIYYKIDGLRQFKFCEGALGDPNKYCYDTGKWSANLISSIVMDGNDVACEKLSLATRINLREIFLSNIHVIKTILRTSIYYGLSIHDFFIDRFIYISRNEYEEKYLSEKLMKVV